MTLAKKAQIWIGAIIYTLVAITAVVLILNSALPALTEIKEVSTYEKVRDVMLQLDTRITDLANQGQGSQGTVSFEIKDGEVTFNGQDLVWQIETESEIIAPRSSIKQGNLIISSSANVITYETADSYIMRTGMKSDTFEVAIKKIGSESSYSSYNTTDLIVNISYNNNTMPGYFVFNLNGNSSSAIGNGYTKLIPEGNNTDLGSAKVVAFMNSTFGTYELEFILESYADFVKVNLKNFDPR